MGCFRLFNGRSKSGKRRPEATAPAPAPVALCSTVFTEARSIASAAAAAASCASFPSSSANVSEASGARPAARARPLRRRGASRSCTRRGEPAPSVSSGSGSSGPPPATSAACSRSARAASGAFTRASSGYLADPPAARWLPSRNSIPMVIRYGRMDRWFLVLVDHEFISSFTVYCLPYIP